jgi:DNA-directed RNA polymerase subunit M
MKYSPQPGLRERFLSPCASLTYSADRDSSRKTRVSKPTNKFVAEPYKSERVLQFCPKCGSTLLPAKREKKVFMACGKCGYTSNRGDKQVSRLAHEREKIVVIGREEQKIRTLPKTKAECPKCNNHEAFYWLVQTRGGDESSTQFFRCTNCGATWRENS